MPINLFMCETCINAKFEPRWVVILAGRSNGPDYVKEIIAKQRYIGKPILASELFV